MKTLGMFLQRAGMTSGNPSTSPGRPAHPAPGAGLVCGFAMITTMAVTPALLRAAAPAFTRVEVDVQPPGNPWIKAVADLDRDGRPDVIIGGSGGPLVWYRNPGWNKFVIAASGYSSVDAEAADVDGDGDPDVVVGGVLWYENPLPKSKPDSGPWRAHRIATHRTHDVEVADLNGDDKIDVVVRGQTGFKHNEGHRILVFTQRAPDEWSARELRCPEGEGLKVADLNRDGQPDIVIGASWFENPGKALDAPWTEHAYTTRWQYGDCKVAVADLNGDGRPDIVLSPAEPKGREYRVAWFEAPANPRQPEWPEHVIGPAIETNVHALDTADMDGDGATDVVFARMHQGAPPQEAAMYLNRDHGRQWVKRVFSERGSHNVVLADINGDGRPDILGANHGGAFQPVELWLNQSRRAGGGHPAGMESAGTQTSVSAPAVLFRCDFESPDWYKEWGEQRADQHTDTVAADPPRRFEPLRGKALRIRVDQGGHYGASLQFNFRKRTGAEPEEIYFRYYLRFGDDWNPERGGKLPGIGGTYGRAGWGGRPVNGTDGWSARGLFEDRRNGRTPIGFYCYHVDMKGRYGSNWGWDKGGFPGLENNRWHCIEQQARMNTPGKSDGILRGWVDGLLVFEKTDVRMRDVDTLKIETVWLNLYYGGTWTAKSDYHVYIDGVAISRQPIGPMQTEGRPGRQ